MSKPWKEELSEEPIVSLDSIAADLSIPEFDDFNIKDKSSESGPAIASLSESKSHLIEESQSLGSGHGSSREELTSTTAVNIPFKSHFKEEISTSSSPRSLSQRISTSKSQTLSSIQNIFSDSEKIAYVSLCHLILTEYDPKRLEKGIASFKTWKDAFMLKLFIYLDISDEGILSDRLKCL